MKFVYHNTLGRWIDEKDSVFYAIGQIGVEGPRHRVMEFMGEAVDALSLDGT
jgi:3-isopropylmalate/(R)-2-methylmalate dehydratase large subunit